MLLFCLAELQRLPFSEFIYATTCSGDSLQPVSPLCHCHFYMLVLYFCVGNILVIVIVAATKTFHSVTSVLIMNLAVSDLLVGVGVMPFVALSIMNRGWVACTVRHTCPAPHLNDL